MIMTPESIWGYELLSSAYDEEPAESWKRIFEHTKEHWPADDSAIIKPKIYTKVGLQLDTNLFAVIRQF